MIGHFLQLRLVYRNVIWWRGGQSLKNKLGYYFAIIATYARYIFSHELRIKYLGADLYYDNPVAPLTLMYYPHEISKKILSNIDGSVTRVLDIGGNIGQFSLTFSNLCPDVKIDSFEPNRYCYEIFKLNAKVNKNIRIYNYGIGPRGNRTLHYSPTQSSIGSLLEDNSKTEITKNLQKTTIKTIDTVPTVTKRKTYDLIKIDVEGYEYNVIKNLKGVKTRYLFIEMSGYGRTKDATSSKVLSAIQSTFGAYEIMNISEANVKSVNFDILVKFNPQR